MHLLFDEAGKFLAGRILSDAEASAQVELDSGKRVKVKAANQLLRFEKPLPAELMASAQALAAEIELPLAWEFAPEDEFGFAELATDYFGGTPDVAHQAAMLLALFEAPHYFRRAGKGRFKKAPADIVAQALAAIEKKKQIAAQIDAWAGELAAGTTPAPIREQLYKILFRPDKNAPEYKAVVEASRATHLAPLALLQKAGAIESAYQFHWQRFLFDNFPKGTGFGALAAPAITEELPLAEVQAFSIDDSSTTEIDDALSLQGLGTGTVVLGIHIAAPGLAIQPGDALDETSRARLSTVYMPGYKITMLPDEVVNAFTLAEGTTCPALSLYATLNPADWSLVSTTTRAELVPIESNLRHNDLDDLVNEATLENGEGDYPHKLELSLLWKWALKLEAGRMAKREAFGLKPEQANRVDFNFYVEDDVVSIVRRKRGAPLDKIVAELMIFANSTWGKLLHDCGVPGIYRSQGAGSGAGWAAKMQVRMVTHAAPHQGLGVDQYAWSTSPLRRYTDLVNQWQIIACAEHGVTAPLVAPFKPRDATLFSIVSAFDAAYSAYNDFQQTMERYWCLRWLGQENARQVDAVVLKDEVLRLVEIPLVIRLPGMQQVPRGAQVRMDIVRWDEVDLSLEARLLEVAEPTPEAAAELELEEEEEAASATADTGEAAAEEAVEAEGSVTVTDPSTQTDVPAA